MFVLRCTQYLHPLTCTCTDMHVFLHVCTQADLCFMAYSTARRMIPHLNTTHYTHTYRHLPGSTPHKTKPTPSKRNGTSCGKTKAAETTDSCRPSVREKDRPPRVPRLPYKLPEEAATCTSRLERGRCELASCRMQSAIRPRVSVSTEK